MAAATELLDAADSESEVTLRRIAATAGITAPAIYAHFADREAILAAIAERGWRDVVAEIRTRAALGTARAGPPATRLRNVRDLRAALPDALRTHDTDGRAHPVRARSPASRDPRAGELPRMSPMDPPSADLPRIAAALSTALHGVAMLNRTDAPSMWLSDVSPAEVTRTLVDSAIDQQNLAEENT